MPGTTDWDTGPLGQVSWLQSRLLSTNVGFVSIWRSPSASSSSHQQSASGHLFPPSHMHFQFLQVMVYCCLRAFTLQIIMLAATNGNRTMFLCSPAPAPWTHCTAQGILEYCENVGERSLTVRSKIIPDVGAAGLALRPPRTSSWTSWGCWGRILCKPAASSSWGVRT